eukprot:11206283-Lingulodinium_polyedra.AAC.1
MPAGLCQKRAPTPRAAPPAAAGVRPAPAALARPAFALRGSRGDGLGRRPLQATGSCAGPRARWPGSARRAS